MLRTITCSLVLLFAAASTALAITPGDIEYNILNLKSKVDETSLLFGGKPIIPEFKSSGCDNVSAANGALIVKNGCDTVLSALRRGSARDDVKNFMQYVRIFQCGCGDNELQFMGGVLQFLVNPDNLEEKKVADKLQSIIDVPDWD